MSDAIEKAARDAVEAADNTDLTRQIVAILAAQQLLNQQQPQQTCQHPTQPQFDAKKWWTIGGLAVVGGGVASVLAIAFALAATAVAIGACCATACLLILRSMWRDFQKTR